MKKTSLISTGVQGPTLTLKVVEYALIRDVQAALARPRMPEAAFKQPPLVVLNGFGQEDHMKLTAVMFQNMFPVINVTQAKLSDCQVCIHTTEILLCVFPKCRLLMSRYIRTSVLDRNITCDTSEVYIVQAWHASPLYICVAKMCTHSLCLTIDAVVWRSILPDAGTEYLQPELDLHDQRRSAIALQVYITMCTCGPFGHSDT